MMWWVTFIALVSQVMAMEVTFQEERLGIHFLGTYTELESG
jgi:hypothetical protein